MSIGPEPAEVYVDKLEGKKIGNGHVLVNGKETSPVDIAVVPILSSDRPTIMASEVPDDQKGSASCELE